MDYEGVKTDLSTTADEMSTLQAKVKEMHLEIIRNENKIMDDRRRYETGLGRINQLENIHKKGDKIN